MTASKEQIRIQFASHGLGDVVHCATAMRLFQQRGHDVQIQVEPNKRWLWQAAGIAIYEGPEQLPIHPYHYPDMNKFWDLAEPDALYSKVAHLFEISELPKLGTKDEVWGMVCSEFQKVKPVVSQGAMDEIARFLDGLPKPIILLHSKGTNWQEEKSIPDLIAFQLICDLIGASNGSIVTLDWDARVPTLGHPRVRSICPHFGHMSTEQFVALCQQSDLMIGVDSGPFHLAGWTGIPTLFVARKIPPVRCCLPSPNATYLVSSNSHEHWVARGRAWKFVEFNGPEATSRDIILTVLSVLNPPAKKGHSMPQLVPETILGNYIYRRVGYDERPMELLEGGQIGDGNGGCERVWAVEQTPVGPVVTIYGEHGGPTCHLRLDFDDILRGSWLAHERMPIELVRQAGRAAPIPDRLNKEGLEDIQEGQIRPRHRGETHKAHERRLSECWFARHIQHPGIDIGSGGDPLISDPLLDQWDITNGNGCAQKMAGISDGKYQTVYASHILEHLTDPVDGLRNWWRILGPGGKLIVCVPHRDLYEKREELPSQWNADHRSFWLPENSEGSSTLGLRDIVQATIIDGEVESLRVLADCYRRERDNHPHGEYSIEIIVRKPLV
jgi:SAM-dependent methyltransferase